MSNDDSIDLASAFLAPVHGAARAAMERYNQQEREKQRAFYEMQPPKVRQVVDVLSSLRLDGLQFSIQTQVWFESPRTIEFRLSTNAELAGRSELSCIWSTMDLDAARWPTWRHDVRRMISRMAQEVIARAAGRHKTAAAAWAILMQDGL